MDVSVRFWNKAKGEVSTRYLTSAFLEKAFAFDLLNVLKSNVSPDMLVKKLYKYLCVDEM